MSSNQQRPVARTPLPCPVCDAVGTIPFIRREQVPVHQNLLMKSRDEARSIARGTLDMHICPGCGFVFNAAFDASLLSYGGQYDNTQTCSPAFGHYVEELVRHLIDDRGVRNKQIVEVGCGKGGFITRLVADPEANNRGIGFDPTYLGETVQVDGRLRFERQFYDAASATVPADVVICRHVIEHVPQPLTLLESVRRATARADTPAQVFFETPCIRWILENQVVWDLFYEHCSLFTAESLEFAFERAGFGNVQSRHVFGGQYLWLEAKSEQAKTAHNQSPIHCAADLVLLAQAYGEAERQQIRNWKALVESHANSGGLCLWGAGAKGVTFANLVDPGGEIIDSVVDLNPAKQSGYLPGTGHPIIGPAELADRGVGHVLLLNPNYTSEVEECLNLHGPHVELVDLAGHQEKLAA